MRVRIDRLKNNSAIDLPAICRPILDCELRGLFEHGVEVGAAPVLRGQKMAKVIMASVDREGNSLTGRPGTKTRREGRVFVNHVKAVRQPTRHQQ